MDLVNGYKISRSDPLHRIVIGRIYHHTVKLLFGLKVRDVDCDFRMMRRSIFDTVHLEKNSGVICLEMMKKITDGGLPHRGSAGAPLSSRLRQVAVLQLPAPVSHGDRRDEAVVRAGHQGRPVIPFLDLKPGVDAADVRTAIDRVVERGWFVLGPELDAFEQEFASACGAAHAIGVGTGTDALALALRALDIGPGDEVITSPLSAAYSALAIMMAGARPVFADIDPDRLTLDPRAAEAAITARTKAIMPVHLYGQPADMPALADVAARHRLQLVEDCCQAHLATCGGRPVGSFGAAAAYSFYPTKNLGALGDGGAITTADAAMAARLRRLRNGGQTDKYHHGEFGVNSRLDEVQAAILRARLAWLPRWTAERRTLAAIYRRQLAGAPVTVPAEHDAGHVYHLFPILSTDRAALQAHLKSRGIETLVHYPVPIPRQPVMASEHPAMCPVADRVCAEVLSLPLHPGMTARDVEEVAAAVRGAA